MHLPTKRVVDILSLLAPEKQGKRLSEISDMLSIPKGTLSPILETLVSEKLLIKKGERYLGGSELFALGAMVAERTPGRDMIRGELRSLSDTLGETCYLGVLDGGEVFYLEKADTTNPLRVLTGVGHRLPAYATGVGKALLMGKSREELSHMYPAPLVRLTPGTVNDIDALYSQLVNFNSQGYSEEIEESTEYIRCFGAPIIKKGETVGAISVAIPTFRYKEEDRNLYIEGLKKTALAIARLWE